MAVQVPQFTTVNAANPTKRDAGTVLGIGTPTDKSPKYSYTRFTNFATMTNALNPSNLQGVMVPNNSTGLGFIQEATPISITSVTQSGLFTLISKTSHGLLVGTPIQVNGTSIPGYNVIHTVKAINNANSFQTDVPYTSNAGTPGTYSLQAGTMAPNTAKKWVASLVCTQLGGIANNALFMMGASNVQSYNPANPTYGIQIADISYISGVVTQGAQWGLSEPYWNITGNATLNNEPIPTRAIPGQLVFTTGAVIPVSKNYNPKTT